jgi:hypothetical protein
MMLPWHAAPAQRLFCQMPCQSLATSCCGYACTRSGFESVDLTWDVVAQVHWAAASPAWDRRSAGRCSPQPVLGRQPEGPPVMLARAAGGLSSAAHAAAASAGFQQPWSTAPPHDVRLEGATISCPPGQAVTGSCCSTAQAAAAWQPHARRWGSEQHQQHADSAAAARAVAAAPLRHAPGVAAPAPKLSELVVLSVLVSLTQPRPPFF